MATLSGTWTLRAIGNEAGWKQRIVITNSVAQDGGYPMVVGTQVAHVEGEAISVGMQAFDPGRNIWIDSLVREAMSFDKATGLQLTLSADDNPPHGDGDFNDLIVLCTAENAELTSPLAGPRPDLTIPERFIKGRRRQINAPLNDRREP